MFHNIDTRPQCYQTLSSLSFFPCLNKLECWSQTNIRQVKRLRVRQEPASSHPFFRQAADLHQQILDKSEYFPRTNTLAYFVEHHRRRKQSLIRMRTERQQPPGTNFIKLFMNVRNKPGCLSLAGLSCLV